MNFCADALARQAEGLPFDVLHVVFAASGLQEVGA